MEGVPATALAVAWSAVMAAVALAAAAVVARRVPAEPGPRILALVAVDGILLVLLVPALLVGFLWPESIGMEAGDTVAFFVPVMVYVLLTGALMVGLVVVPAIRRRGAANDPGRPPSGTVRR